MPNSSLLSETTLEHWLAALRAGESRATRRLWELYFEKMVRLARRKLDRTHRLARDEEDIALSAFKSFCLGLQGGKFSRKTDSLELWPILMTLTLNKAIDHIRHTNRQKRKSPQATQPPDSIQILEQVAGNQPLPELEVAARESFQWLLDQLGNCDDPTLQELAVWRIHGASIAEIAAAQGCTERTIQRKLKTIRAIWDRASDELH